MNKDFKICTVVQGKTIDTFLKKLMKAQLTSTMVELRVDSITDMETEYLEALKMATLAPSIFTFRHKKEGGLYNGTIVKQNKIIKKAFSFDFTYIDVSWDNPLVNNLTRKEKRRLILSWHDFEKTPPLAKLQDILEKMRKASPAIIKIATMVNDPQDMAFLSQILASRNKDERLIVIGMGEKGKLSRLLFPRFGSYLTFVAMKGDTDIAPGMITEDELISPK